MKKPAAEETVSDYQVRYTRRKYGRKTYTWAEVRLDGEWHGLGDPWPCVVIPKAELIAAIEYLRDLFRPSNGRQNLSCFI